MNTGSVLAQFTITLSKAVSEQVAVEWHTADGTAIAGVDYAAAKGTMLFAPGQTAKTVEILVHGRAVGSEDRSFFVEMLPPTNAILGASIGECIIHVDTAGSTPVTQIIVPTGPRGLQGDSAYQAWLDLGNTGTEQDFIDSLKPSAAEIAQEVAPLIDLSNSPLTAEGTETLSKPDAITGKRLARRVAYVGAAKVATVVLADGDNIIANSDLTGDSVNFSSVGLYPRIARGAVFISPVWSVAVDGRLLIKGAVAGDVLYVCQYDSLSSHAITRLPIEAMCRSYADAGYDMDRTESFEKGGILSTVGEVLLFEANGIGYSWGGALPKSVPAGSTPSSSGGVGVGAWVSKENELLRSQLNAASGATLSLSQVATAYGLPFDKLAVWSAGAASDMSKYWWYDNKVWQSNIYPHTLESTPSFTTSHIVPLDGKLYPDHFGATYIPGTDQTPAIARCEAWQKGSNKPLYLRATIHDLLTQLQITRAPFIIGDGGGYDSLRNQKISAGRTPRGAVLHGKVVGDFSVKIKPTQYWFGGYVENVTVVGRVDPLASKTDGSGVLMDEFGWSAKISGLTIEDFTGSGLSIGYLQDTTFDRLTILGCGDTAASASLKFTRNANFLYFNDPHIEDGNYLLSSEGDANGAAWEIHWKGAHFEVGNYTGTPDPSLEHRYATPCVSFVGLHRHWYWNECTHVPVGASFLQAANGGTVDSQPYYMQGDQVAGFKFTDCNFNRATTGCDFINLASPTQALIREFGVNEFKGTRFSGANPTKSTSPVKVDDGRFIGGGIDFWTGYNSSQLNGFNVARGSIDKTVFSSTGDTVNKTGGKLIQSPISAGLTVGECEYDLSKDPYIWLTKECCLSDFRSKYIKNINASISLNMELEKPGTTYQLTAVATINDITNCQRGRRIRFFNTSGADCTFAQTPTLYPNGASTLTINHLVGIEFASDLAGISVKY